MSKIPLINPTTLVEKAFMFHSARSLGGGKFMQGIPKHVMHEVTSGPFFDLLRKLGISPYDISALLGVIDHNIATTEGGFFDLKDIKSQKQIFKFMQNSLEFGVKTFHESDPRNGIIHMAPIEQSFIGPGDFVIGCDSHTTTAGGISAHSMGVGSSEGAHQVATGALPLNKLKTMRINIDGALGDWLTAKDVIMHIIAKYGTDGGAEYALEFAGSTIRNMDVSEYLTLCNMAIEFGAQVAMVGVNDKIVEYVKALPNSPKGKKWKAFEKHIRKFASDSDATFDKEHYINAADISHMTTFGTNPGHAAPINSAIPKTVSDEILKALEYTQLKPGQELIDIKADIIFLGSCTNGRIEDLRLAAFVIKALGLKKHADVQRVLMVPGSMFVKFQAEDEGLDKIFIEAGFEWRWPGCSSCLGMNPDTFSPGTRIFSTSNRNFKGRQGKGAITHLCSPLNAMIAAVYGKFMDPVEVLGKDTQNIFENIPVGKDPKKLKYFLNKYTPKDVSTDYEITNEVFKSSIKLHIAMTRQEDVDTDELAPSDYLKVTTQEEINFLGNHLCDEQRFTDKGIPGTKANDREENKDFFLNQKKYRNAQVLVAGKNFACGSSREHAIWALTGYGFKVVIAESVSNIATGNSLYNRLLLIKPTAEEMSKLFDIVESTEDKSYIEIDLINETATIGDLIINFKVDALAKEAILTGKDIVNITRERYMKDIDAFHAWLKKYKTWES